MLLKREQFPMTVEQYAKAAGVCEMRVYRMIKAGQLRTNAARPVMIQGLRKKGYVPRRIWRHRIEEAAERAGLKPHRYGFRPGGAFHVLVAGEAELVVKQGQTVGALEAAVERIAALERKRKR